MMLLVALPVLLSTLLGACDWSLSEGAMVRNFLAHEQEFAEIVEVFNNDSELLGIQPGLAYPEQRGLATSREIFERQAEKLEALSMRWADRSGSGIKFYKDNSISIAYGYYYSPYGQQPSLPNLEYKTVAERGYGTYYKHIKGKWYLYAEYMEW